MFLQNFDIRIGSIGQERRKALKSEGPRALAGLTCMENIPFLWRSCILCGGQDPLGPPSSYAYGVDNVQSL